MCWSNAGGGGCAAGLGQVRRGRKVLALCRSAPVRACGPAAPQAGAVQVSAVGHRTSVALGAAAFDVVGGARGKAGWGSAGWCMQGCLGWPGTSLMKRVI